MKPAPLKICVIAIASLFSTGCATDPRTGQPSFQETFASNDPCSNNGRNIGVLAGAVAGAFFGNQVDHSNRARLVGAAVGGVIGAAIGHDIDRRRCALHRIARDNSLDMQVVDIKPEQVGAAAAGGTEQRTTQLAQDAIGMQVTIKDNAHQFESGSDALTPEAAHYFRQIAAQYSYANQRAAFGPNPTPAQLSSIDGLRNRRILLVGHTDDTGASAANADLSERRAKAVARIFQEQGVLEDNLYFQGAGETLPVADNRTAEGRERNRRVEIIDLADDTAFRGFLARRTVNLAYYRNTEAMDTSVPGAPGTDSSAKTGRPYQARKQASSIPALAAKRAPAAASPGRTASPPAAAAAGIANTEIDFGGYSDLKKAVVDIGKVESASSFSLISTAHADVPVVSACINDRPRIAHGVKSLKGDVQYETADYMPGLYQTSWTDTVNGHLVALTNVAVLRDSGMPANRPNLLIYRNYKPGSSPIYKGSPDVNVYRGEKAVLYRIFVHGPVQCIDMVIPNATPGQAPGSHLFYSKASTTYVADLHPRLAKH